MTQTKPGAYERVTIQASTIDLLFLYGNGGPQSLSAVVNVPRWREAPPYQKAENYKLNFETLAR